MKRILYTVRGYPSGDNIKTTTREYVGEGDGDAFFLAYMDNIRRPEIISRKETELPLDERLRRSN